MLRTERNHGGGATVRGRDGGGVEVVGGHHAHRGQLLDVAMAVDAAGEHQLAGRIDGLCAFEVGADLDDALPLDADVRAKNFFCRGDGAAANDEVECHGYCAQRRLIASQVPSARMATRPLLTSSRSAACVPFFTATASGTSRNMRRATFTLPGEILSAMRPPTPQLSAGA